jgi:hypothetical protein
VRRFFDWLRLPYERRMILWCLYQAQQPKRNVIPNFN